MYILQVTIIITRVNLSIQLWKTFLKLGNSPASRESVTYSQKTYAIAVQTVPSQVWKFMVHRCHFQWIMFLIFMKYDAPLHQSTSSFPWELFIIQLDKKSTWELCRKSGTRESFRLKICLRKVAESLDELLIWHNLNYIITEDYFAVIEDRKLKRFHSNGFWDLMYEGAYLMWLLTHSSNTVESILWAAF